MEQALLAHQSNPNAKPANPSKDKVLAENYPAAKRLNNNGCIHCHQVHEFQRDQLKSVGTWKAKMRWIYPLPENIGVELVINEGNLVDKVHSDSAAAKAGIKAGDRLISINNVSIASTGDVQYALHKAPAEGELPVKWKSGLNVREAELRLSEGWRRTNTTWRPSLLEILPAFPLYGNELSAAEKAKLNLPGGQLAFRIKLFLKDSAKKSGVKLGDIVVGINEQKLKMTLPAFLGYVRQNYFVGDTLMLDVIRNGRRTTIPLKL